MNILLNGQPRELPEGVTAAALIDLLGLTGRRLAMEIDGEILPRSAFAGRILRDGERVEIVHAIGGG